MRTLSAAFLTVLLLSAVAGILLENSGANPSGPPQFLGIESPRSDTNPPTVSVLSPNNNTLQNGSVMLTLNVTTPTGPYVGYPCIVEIYYTTSWNQTRTSVSSNRDHIAQYPLSTFMDATPYTFSGSLNLTEIPDGNQRIDICAEYLANYIYPTTPVTYSRFYITGYSKVNFAVDSTPPRVSVLSPQNRQYDSTDVQLLFIVDEEDSNLSYSLDGAEKVALLGNITLTGLSLGTHNVTVYACDDAGNIGASKQSTSAYLNRQRLFQQHWSQ
jgi:hypothetical protein